MAAQIPGSDQIKQYKEILGDHKKFTETSFLDYVTDHTTKEVKPEQQNKDMTAKGLLGQP
ncbi:mitochondrial import inner membrane translocase subunit Tim9-like isoform X2 [Enhydra lutris kenyoni]|uniref:Mitochondrial import inner membrane translocase subunit Tim9-like isoform X2 n=1 Tax=Enhydra lutris kenyoni TaxID=391180 RepID=A0A2Y9J529_ENHLU|nr:mitochondrial import inner membrane translocase subunit Tim9-like isoform X2 [Enhydra lutris kenyoni]